MSQLAVPGEPAEGRRRSDGTPRGATFGGAVRIESAGHYWEGQAETMGSLPVHAGIASGFQQMQVSLPFQESTMVRVSQHL